MWITYINNKSFYIWIESFDHDQNFHINIGAHSALFFLLYT